MADDPLAYLFSLEHFGIKFGLENIRAILAALGHPERAFPSVHIAGTNGKGSVTAMVDAALQAAGYHSARYTSPHLVHLAERFVIDGRPVADDVLIEGAARVRDVVQDLQARGVLDVHPTFFEVTTAVAFDLFRSASVDIAVFEVGLGGRLDATNVLAPRVTAITSIGLDHEQYLGSSEAEIASEKAGIIKPGVPVVLGALSPEAAAPILRVAAECGAPVRWAREGTAVGSVRADQDGRQTMTLRTASKDYGLITVALAGAHQIDNATVAVSILEELDRSGFPIPTDAVRQGLAEVRWPGRLQRLMWSDGREMLLDAAHNPAGARSLAAFLEPQPKRPLVFAAMRDKDARGVLRALVPAVSAIVVTRATTERAAAPETLAEIVRDLAPDVAVEVQESVPAALDAAWRRSERIVVAGSIYLLGDVLKAVGAGPS